MDDKPKLLDQVREQIRLRHYVLKSFAVKTAPTDAAGVSRVWFCQDRERDSA